MSESTDSEDEFHTFEEGDVLTVRGHRYRVAQVDFRSTDGRVHQYRLDALGDAPPARLLPDESWEKYSFHPVFGVEPGEIQAEADND